MPSSETAIAPQELKPAALYAVILPEGVTKAAIELLDADLAKYGDPIGAKFLLFDAGTEIFEVRPVGSEDVKQAVREAIGALFSELHRALSPNSQP